MAREHGGPRSWLGLRRRRAAPSSGGTLIYAVGDVHGRADLLEALLSQVEADAGPRPYLLVLCGDYVDRGPASAAVLDQLIALRRRLGDRLVLLKGNHEQALLRFIERPAQGGPWLERFGGRATLRSYGVATDGLDTPEGLAAARDQLLATMPAAHLLLLQRLELMRAHHDYAFVHAGISPDAPLAEQTEDDLLWARDGFLDAKGPFEKVIVHGHTWTDDRPALLDHRIGLDTGAYATGALSAVRIEDGEHAVLQALDAEAAARRTARAAARQTPLVGRPADYLRPAPEELRTTLAAHALTLAEAS